MQLFENKIFLSFSIITIILLVKILTIKLINKEIEDKTEKTLSLSNTIKNISNLILLITLFYIWMSELQNFALSIAAFTVAIVLATREYIQCLIGFIYITSAQPFRVGDWIEVGENSGEVISTDWAKVTILEVENCNYSYTGKTLYIPNYLVITNTVKNLNFFKRYLNHQFTITMEPPFNPFKIKAQLTKEINILLADFKDVATRYNSIIEKKLEVNIAGPEPIISISTTDLGKLKTTFSIFCPTGRVIEMENYITEVFLTLAAKEAGQTNNAITSSTD